MFKPTAEQARYHIRTAVMAMLSQPATSGKPRLNNSFCRSRESSFQKKSISGSDPREGTAGEAQTRFVRNFIVVLIKEMLSSSSTAGERGRSATAINAIRSLNPSECHLVLAKDLFPTLRAVADPDYALVVASVSRLEDSVDYVDNDVRTRMEQYVNASTTQKFAIVAELALAVPFLASRVEAKLVTENIQDFTSAVTARPQL